MTLSIKAKQVAGVTSIVGIAVIVLGGLYVSGVARVRLEASQAAGQLLANAIYHRARSVAAGSPTPYAALAADPGLRSILEASAYSPNVTYAAIVDTANVAVAHSDPDQVGRTVPARIALDDLLAQNAWAQLRAIYAGEAATLEIRHALLTGDRPFGTIRIGVSTLLTRADIDNAVRPAALTALIAVIVASLAAMLLARSLLRPIHLIRAGLSRLGRGEFGVAVDVTGRDELGDLGGFVNSLSAQLSAERVTTANAPTPSESAEERLEATLRHARQLAAMSRLTAGIAHEIRNPLNAIAIHLELLAQRVLAEPDTPASTSDAPRTDRAAIQQHLSVIRTAMARLDEVLQGYLKFTRPDDLQLQSVSLRTLVDDLLPLVRVEAERVGVDVQVDCPLDLPDLLGDPGMLRQALLNLALNACQAMPHGGRLRITGRPAPGGRVEIVVDDTGTGIPPEELNRVFDLYFTTKPGGSGMGLSMVYRTIRLHDGDIEVDSSPGSGTAVRMLLPRA
jgi:signal transduction histidine kinase